MNKGIAVSIIVILAVGVIVTGHLFLRARSEVVALEENVSSLQTKLSESEAQVSSLQRELRESEARVSSLEENVSSLQRRLRESEAKVSSLSEELARLRRVGHPGGVK